MKIPAQVGPWLAQRPTLMYKALSLYARANGCRLQDGGDTIVVSKGDRVVRLRAEHGPYVRDVIDDFDSYFSSVVPAVSADGALSVDFSRGAEQQLTGWDLFPVRLPGLPEPMTTVRQYVDLTGMSQGDVVLDLGAYAGVTAMEFQEVVGQNGRVVAVEADPSNIACARENISRYTRLRGYGPTLIEAAVWSQSGSVDFTAEGSLGSAVTVVLPRAAGSNATVRAVTLSEVMSLGSLTRVDIIKADIEGAEYMAFSDAAFFASQHPTLVFEPAGTTVALTQLGHIKELLGGYGYTCKVVDQEGSRLPLVVCR